MSGKNLTLWQVIDPDLPGSPIIALRFQDGKLRLTTRTSADRNFGTVRMEQPIAPSAVHDVVISTRLGTSGDLDVWVDGVHTFSGKSVPIGDERSSRSRNPYQKIGLYAAGGIKGVVSAEFANLDYWQEASLAERIKRPPAWPED